MIINGNKSTFVPPPEGLWDAVCVDFVELGLIDTSFGQVEKCRLVFQFHDEKKKSWMASQMFTPSLNKKANLRKALMAWRGRDFTKEELDAFNTENLIGKCAQIVIQHVEKDGTVYANIISMLKAKKTVKPDGTYIRVKDRPDYKPPRRLQKAEQEAPADDWGQSDAPIDPADLPPEASGDTGPDEPF